MAEQTHPVRIEEIDWLGVFPWLRLFRSFRMALHASKLFLSLLLVFLLYLGGHVLDAAWGPKVFPGELREYASRTLPDFEQWRAGGPERTRSQLLEAVQWIPVVDARALVDAPDSFADALKAINDYYAVEHRKLVEQKDPALGKDDLRRRSEELQQQRRERLNKVRALESQGVFASGLHAEVNGFERLSRAATLLNFGLRDFLSDTPQNPASVLGALRAMLVLVPSWVLHTHYWFLLIYAVYGLLLWSLLGGAVTRLAALHACKDERSSTGGFVAFTVGRWGWFLLAPLLPLFLVGFLGGVLALSGLVFFNWSALEIVGAVLLGVLLVLGLVMALLLIGVTAGASLLYPAIAVEGTDAFDAVSRCFNYVLGRPWRWAFYQLIAMVYGGVCYLFVASVLFLTVKLTHFSVELGVFREAGQGVNRWDAILPAPRLGALAYQVDWSLLNGSGKIAAVIVWIWVNVSLGLLAAFAISFFLTANTWVYLLLRRSVDGTEFDEVFAEQRPPEAAPPTPSAAGAAPLTESADAG